MKVKHTQQPIKWWAMAALVVILFFSCCKKDQSSEEGRLEESQTNVQNQNNEKPPKKVNPFSYENIKKAKKKLEAQHKTSNASNKSIEERLYSYLKLDPDAVSGAMLQQLEADTTIRILNFPFADGGVYDENFALDEEKAEQLADGKLYAVVQKNSATDITLKTSSSLNTVLLDELYLPDEEDTTLQFQAFREAGFTEAQIEQMRICLFKRPSGFVRYLDQETNRLVNVPGMQVWGLVFGIPLHTYTDENGHYRFPWRFTAGTIMGTHAKNNRVNIKPFNTQGAWWLTIPLQFIVGSIHIHGWVGACAMRNDVNFEFTNHRQNRYWAQLMNAVSLHDGYCATDQIDNAPQKLVMYAHWADNYGNASAPMLGHISTSPASLIQQYFTGLFDGTDPTNHPNLFNLLTGLLPDITIRVADFEQDHYSARLMQTALHELGHGSHFRRAGQGYWIDLIIATIDPHGGCPNYGCGTGNNDGHTAVAESWAEFIGTNHALRNHPSGEKRSTWAGGFIRFDDALERETWFANNWIPTGIYNDLIDVNNTNALEDVWDRTGGLTMDQLYEALGPNVTSICDYLWEILNRYPQLSLNDVNTIFVEHGFMCL